MIYTHKKVGFWDRKEALPDSYKVGIGLDDYYNSAYILLDESQEAFYKANPKASQIEVLNKKLTPPIPGMTQEELDAIIKENQIASKARKREEDQQSQLVTFAKMAVRITPLSDEDALEVKLLHPEWKEFIGLSLEAGTRVLYEDRLYKVRQAITSVLSNQAPSINTAALYEEINEVHLGTAEDPIPYNNNMELKLGKYYSQNEVTYMCFRDTGAAVYQDLSALISIYVQAV